MGHGGRTRERLQMVAAKAGNYTLMEDEFDLWVDPNEFLCLVYFQHYYLMLPRWHLGVVVSQTAQMLGTYSLSSAVICSSTSCVNTQTVVNRLSIQLVISNAAEYS